MLQDLAPSGRRWVTSEDWSSAFGLPVKSYADGGPVRPLCHRSFARRRDGSAACSFIFWPAAASPGPCRTGWKLILFVPAQERSVCHLLSLCQRSRTAARQSPAPAPVVPHPAPCPAAVGRWQRLLRRHTPRRGETDSELSPPMPARQSGDSQGATSRIVLLHTWLTGILSRWCL